MIERVASTLTFAHKIPEYQARALYLRQRAVLESLKGGYNVDEDKGVALIDSPTTTAITLPNNQSLEFAIDEDGVAFARIKDGKYYPLNVQLSKELLEQSDHYERLSRSSLRRVLHMPFEQQTKLLFQVQSLTMEIGDAAFALYLTLDRMEENIKKLDETIETLDRTTANIDKTAAHLQGMNDRLDEQF